MVVLLLTKNIGMSRLTHDDIFVYTHTLLKHVLTECAKTKKKATFDFVLLILNFF